MIFLGMVLSVNITKTRKVDILTALCILTVIGQWNTSLPHLCAPNEMRKFQRATADAFITHYYTSNGGEVDSFHQFPHGLGLYDLVRKYSGTVLELLPASGRDRTLNIPRG